MSVQADMAENERVSLIQNVDSNTESATTALKGDDDDDVFVAFEGEHDANGTISSTIIAILCNVVGGGLLALSAVFDHASIIAGCFMLCFVAFLSGLSMLFLVRMAERTQKFSYMELWKMAMKGSESSGINRLAAEGAIVWYTFGVLVAYVVLISDLMAPLADSWMGLSGFMGTGTAWVLICSPFLFLFSCARRLNELKITSILAFATTVYVGVMVVVRYAQLDEAERPAHPNVHTINSNILRVIPVMAVCFSMHYNVPPLYKELTDRTPRRMGIAVSTSFLMIIVFYLIVGVTGYLAWGKRIHEDGGDLLAHYSNHDTLINLGRLFMFLHFVCVYPIITMGCRRSLNLIVFQTEDISTKLRVAETFGLTSASVLLGIVAKGINHVLSFNGSLFGVHIIMTIPAVMYWHIMPEKSTTERVLTVLLGGSGVVFSVVSFIATLLALINGVE
eukprot:PhM_4_TR18013/c0_g1_i3/m.33382